MSILSKFAALTSARNATADALNVVEELREQIVDLKADLDRLAAAPQPVADAMASFDAWAQRVATDAIDSMRVGKLLDAHSAPEGLDLQVIPVRVGDGMSRDYGAATRTLLGLVVATSMPALRKIVQGQLEDLTLGKEVLTPSARAKKIAGTEARLLEVELLEEAAIRALEAAGVSVERRADADPRVVLAADESLPNA